MEQGLIRSHELEFAFLYRLADLSIILLVMLTASFSSETVWPSWPYFVACSIGCLVFLLAAESVKLYRSWRMSAFSTQVGLMLFSWACAVLTLLLVGYASNNFAYYDRALILAWVIATPLVMLLWRQFMKGFKAHMRARGRNTRSAIIVGITDDGVNLAKEFERERSLGVVLKGFYDDRNDGRIDSLATRRTGSVAEALEVARRGEVDQVYIAMPLSAQGRIHQYLEEFSDTTATTYLVPNFFVYNLMCARWSMAGDVPTLSVFDTPFSGPNAWLKRAEDLTIASVIVLLMSPLLLLIAAGVKLSSPGPVLFKQDRYGLDGRKIKVWKFRSMSVQENGQDVVQATKDDPRVTPFGSFLRRTSLDELPQFFNVLQGDMSVVGPRPHAVAHNEQYRTTVSRYMLRHKVKPGITGWAQINGYRGETDVLEKMEKRVEFDLDYIHKWSLWMDIKIVLLTVAKGFVSKTAY